MKKTVTVFMTLMLLCITTPVHAEEIQDSPTLQIIVDYSGDITPQTGDTFTIRYRAVGSEKEATMQFDTSKLVGKTGNLKLQQGSYEITDISYEGYNEKINTDGFAVSNSFDSSYDYSPMYLNIGATAGQRLLDEYDNVFAVKAGSYVTELSDEGSMVIQEEEEKEKDPERQEETDAKPDDDDDEEEELEKKKEPEEKKAEYHFNYWKLFPILVIAVIGTCVLFILNKKKKI